ncbi:MAG: AAA family ATPase [Bacteroidales bacterium]|nr:AAA family ATPase [Bacteroidales bacterium]
MKNRPQNSWENVKIAIFAEALNDFSMSKLIKRKVDSYLMEWKNNPERKPLIIKGARQIGKTRSIEWFASQNYSSVVQINFVEQKKYKDIFNDGFEVDIILKNISLLNPEFKFIPGKTLFFFDELQECPNCTTSLKFFKLDGRFDVICSGSLMGINYKDVDSNSVGYKDYY